MARFYTNPFVKDAPMARLVRTGEERYLGLSHTASGSSQEWGRDLEYSDGTITTHITRSEPWSPFRTLALNIRHASV